MTEPCSTIQKKCRIKTLFGSREDIESPSHNALHNIWGWAKKLKTDTFMRLRSQEKHDILELREKDFKFENGLYYPSDTRKGVSLFNLFGLIDSTISGEIFLISSEAFSNLPQELMLLEDLSLKKPIHHYLIGLSTHCKEGLEHSVLASYLNKFTEKQKNNIFDIGVKFDYIASNSIKNSRDKINAMKSRIEHLKSSKKFENLFTDLYLELNICQEIIEEYLKRENKS